LGVVPVVERAGAGEEIEVPSAVCGDEGVVLGAAEHRRERAGVRAHGGLAALDDASGGVAPNGAAQVAPFDLAYLGTDRGQRDGPVADTRTDVASVANAPER